MHQREQGLLVILISYHDLILFKQANTYLIEMVIEMVNEFGWDSLLRIKKEPGRETRSSILSACSLDNDSWNHLKQDIDIAV